MIKPTPGLSPDPERKQRVILAVLDGAGAGALPDAGAYGDERADTLRHVLARHGPLDLPHLNGLGLMEIFYPHRKRGWSGPPCYRSFYGRMAPLSPGKDTTSGHWELAGLVLNKPFPVYPRGFPPAVIEPFEQAIERKILGNVAASGTEIIAALGEEHLRTGFPIVYTSADSVFQVAAHEALIPPEQLYRWCRIAREILQGEHGVGRVIARPFTGAAGSFTRTGGRKDFSLSPPGATLLDKAAGAGYPVAAIGKVADIFNHRGITLPYPGGGNEATAESLLALLKIVPRGILWATFGDFDTLYGHRNDSAGFASALKHFDLFLGAILSELEQDDLLFVTADHGCDPTHPGTDHTREYVPLMAWSPGFEQECVNLGERSSLADLGATAASWLNLPPLEFGRSFL